MIDWLHAEIRRAPTLYAAVLVFVVACVAYLNTLDAGFHYDDSHHIVDNPHVRDTRNIPDYFTRPDMFSGNPRLRMYRPVLMTTYALNYSMGGYQPLSWRLTALALHALVAVGVLLVFRRLAPLLRQDPGNSPLAGALVAALVFAVHPVFSETVDYASARSSLLCTMLLVWALYFHVAAGPLASGGLRVLGWSLSLTLFALALLTKSIAVVYPALLGLLAWRRGVAWRGVWPAVALTLLYLFARQVLLGNVAIDFSPRSVADADPHEGGRRPITWNLYTQARVLVAYLALFLRPTGLSIDHHVRVSRTPWEWGVAAGVAVAVGLLVVAWRLRRRRPLAALGIVWFLVALAPTSTIIPLNVVMNEHRLYLPGIGFALALGAWLGPVLRDRGPRPRLAFAAACALLALLTLQRNQDWRDPVRLWEAAVKASPESYGAWNNLGVQRRERNDDFEGAEAAFRRALELRHDAWEVTLNLGSLYLHYGQRRHDETMLVQADLWVRRSLEIEPTAYRSRWYLAEVAWARGRKEDARRQFDLLAAEDAWFYEMTRYRYARMALEEGDLARARAYYEEALALGKDLVVSHLGLAEVAQRAGRDADARRHAQAAMAAAPHDARPYVFLAKFVRGPRAIRYLFEAEQRGYRPTDAERREILGAP